MRRSAAEWFAARRERKEPQTERRFAQWLSEDPRNADEYALCELTWELSASAAEGLEDDVRATPWYARRGAFFGLAAAACAALVAIGALWLRPPAATAWKTAANEQRSIALEDGSHITLNTRTALEIRMGRSLREIRLLGGEAFFEVAADPKRPFVVLTAFGQARAIGTRFNVLLDTRHVEVSTEEGRVLVNGPGGASPGVLTDPGQRATLVRGSAVPRLDRADLGRIMNWRAHRLEFDRVPLDAALREFSRYSTLPVQPATPEVGQIPVSAVLRTGDIDALRATLHAAFGLELVAGADGWLVVAPTTGE